MRMYDDGGRVTEECVLLPGGGAGECDGGV